jgi:hypothetical protein
MARKEGGKMPNQILEVRVYLNNGDPKKNFLGNATYDSRERKLKFAAEIKNTELLKRAQTSWIDVTLYAGVSPHAIGSFFLNEHSLTEAIFAPNSR